MSDLVPPHGSNTLIPLALEGNDLFKELEKAKSLPKISCSSRELGDVIMLGIGGFTPLDGFMNKQDWLGVCENMQTANGTFWPIPITLSTDDEDINEKDEVSLVNSKTEEIIATMFITEKYTIDKQYECEMVYKTTEMEHPGVVMVMEQGKYNLGGPIKVLSDGGYPEKYGDLYMTPTKTRDNFQDKGWSTIAAFQTRNPMHMSHEYLVNKALDTCDGVMIHSTLGELKPGDIPAEVRSEAIYTLINNYFEENKVLQSGYPLDMRYAGPREALLHALFRQNYGCSHLIVGRDHAGISDYYGPFDAHNIFDEIGDELLTQPLKLDWSFWCNKCAEITSMDICPHNNEDRLLLSGSKLRYLLSANLKVPENFSRPEVLNILRKYYASLKGRKKTKVELTGHSAK